MGVCCVTVVDVSAWSGRRGRSHTESQLSPSLSPTLSLSLSLSVLQFLPLYSTFPSPFFVSLSSLGGRSPSALLILGLPTYPPVSRLQQPCVNPSRQSTSRVSSSRRAAAHHCDCASGPQPNVFLSVCQHGGTHPGAAAPPAVLGLWSHTRGRCPPCSTRALARHVLWAAAHCAPVGPPTRREALSGAAASPLLGSSPTQSLGRCPNRLPRGRASVQPHLRAAAHSTCWSANSAEGTLCCRSLTVTRAIAQSCRAAALQAHLGPPTAPCFLCPSTTRALFVAVVS